MTARDGKKMIASWQEQGLFAERLPELERLKGVPQPGEYHGEGDAFVHTMLAIEAVADEADIRVFWGTLLHDIGKSATTEMIHGRWRSFGHAEAGAAMAQTVMERLGLPELARDVAWLVKHHMFHFSWHVTPGARLSRNQLRFMEHPLFPLLLQVCAADAAASLGSSRKGDAVRLLAALHDDMTKQGTI